MLKARDEVVKKSCGGTDGSSVNPIRFGDKWAALIVRCLEYGPRRFSELRVPLNGVTPKVLTQSLRSLERNGLVERTVYADTTPHVEYELTPLGRSMLEPMAVACAWVDEHWDELLDARESYDSAPRPEHAGPAIKNSEEPATFQPVAGALQPGESPATTSRVGPAPSGER